jgi:DNA repair ATPase RecN
MKQISKVIYRNIQRHRKIEVEFDQGFNVLVGDNQGGKSAMIRGLYWLFTNSPSGDWMCRRTKKEKLTTASVKVFFTDGTTVERIKGESENKYIFNEEEFTGFGTKIPTPIKEYFGKVELDINGVGVIPGILMQDEPPFLQQESSILRGGVMNYLTGVSVIDKGRKDFAKTIGTNTRDINSTEKLIKDQVAELEMYEGLPEINESLKEVTKLYTKLQGVANKRQALNKLLVRANKYHMVLANTKVPQGSSDKLKRAYEAVTNISKAVVKFSKYVDVKLPEFCVGQVEKLSKDFEMIGKIGDVMARTQKTNLKVGLLEHNLKKHTDELKTYDGKRCGECGSKIKVKK